MNRRDFLKYALILTQLNSFASPSESEPIKQKQSEQKPFESKEKRPIILCFDGSYNLNKWRKSIDFAKSLEDLTNEKVHFSYFVNSAYFFEKLEGRSDIGYGGTKEDIQNRLKLVQEAIDNGHDIASHTVRHLHGHNWTEEQGHKELEEFDSHLAKLFYKDSKPYKAVGFRAPYLEWNSGLYPALKKLNYLYDVSIPGDFKEEKSGIIIKGLPEYKRDNKSRILGMDYNWTLLKISDTEVERMFSRELELKPKEPLIISLHFADYKHGLRSYYETTKDFMKESAKSGNFSFPSMREFLFQT